MSKWLMIFLSFYAASATAQRLQIDKTLFIAGTHRDSYVYDAVATEDGGFFWCGTTFDSGTGNIPRAVVPWDNRLHLLIGKVDNQGRSQWVKTLTGADDLSGVSVCTTANGNYVLLTSTLSNRGDIRMQCLDRLGEFKWSSSFGSPGQEFPLNVQSTPDGGFIVLGQAMGVGGDIPYNYQMPILPMQPCDWVLIKTDSLGRKEWIKVIGTSGDEFNGKVVCDGSSYYLAGSTITKDHDCIDSIGREGYTGYSPYVIKVDQDGNILWSKTYGGGSVFRAWFDDRDSSVLVVGEAGAKFEFVNPKGRTDMFCMKVDRDGNYKWSVLCGDANSQGTKGICAAPNNGYLLVGTTFKTVQSPYTYIGAEDILLYHIDSSGVQRQAKLFGSSEADLAYGIIRTASGVFIYGNSGGSNMSEGAGTNQFWSAGGPQGLFFSMLDKAWLSIFTNSVDRQLAVKPNPVTSQLTIQLPENGAGIISISDASGKEVVRKQTSKGEREVTIRASNLQAGICIVSFYATLSNAIYTSKITVSK